MLALGKLGGLELNYSSDIDLIFISDGDGKTDGDRPVTNAEFFDRLAIADQSSCSPNRPSSALPIALTCGCDPMETKDPPCGTGKVPCAITMYRDVPGNARHLSRPELSAGDHDLGAFVLDQLQPWIYRRYLTGADIAGIKALKRRIEKRAHA